MEHWQELWRQWITSPLAFEGSLFFFSIFAGVLGALLGLGGGIIIVPVLTLLYGVNIRYAIGASLVSIIATSSGAAAAYVKDHLTNIRLAMLLEVATTLGAISGAVIAPFVPTHWLMVAFAVIVIYSSFVMLKKRRSEALPLDQNHPWARHLKLNSEYPDRAAGRDSIPYAVGSVPTGMIIMLGAGLLSGLLGIGSGVLKVPAMDTIMHLPIKVSSATSNFMIGVTGAASAGTYFMRGEILPMVAAPVALGVLTGSWIGTRLMMRLQSTLIRKIFVCVLVVIAAQMIFKALGARQ